MQLFFVLLMASVIISCGDDEDSATCSQADFIGIYTIIGDDVCSADSTTFGPEAFFLEAGPTATTLLEDGDEDLILNIVGCQASDEFVTYTIIDNEMEIQLGTCSWRYTKN